MDFIGYTPSTLSEDKAALHKKSLFEILRSEGRTSPCFNPILSKYDRITPQI